MGEKYVAQSQASERATELACVALGNQGHSWHFQSPCGVAAAAAAVLPPSTELAMFPTHTKTSPQLAGSRFYYQPYFIGENTETQL